MHFERRKKPHFSSFLVPLPPFLLRRVINGEAWWGAWLCGVRMKKKHSEKEEEEASETFQSLYHLSKQVSIL